MYGIDAERLFTDGKLRLVAELDRSCGAWATQVADRLLEHRRRLPESIRWVVFLALARAHAPIEPRWDALLPVVHGEPGWAAEVAGAIPSARRGPAVAAALRASHPDYALTVALDLLEEFPAPEILDAYFDVAREVRRSPRLDLPRLDKVAAGAPAIAATLAARLKGKPSPLRLRVTQELRPTSAGELTTLQQAQLRSIGTLLDGRVRTAAQRLAEGYWETSATLRGLVTIREVADAAGNACCTVFEYLGDAGTIYRAGTMDVIGRFIQGGLECDDPRLHEGLQLALAARARTGTRGASTRAATSSGKRPAAKAAAKPATKAGPRRAAKAGKTRPEGRR